MFTALPYPDRIALKLVSFCPGKVSMNKDMTKALLTSYETLNMQAFNN